MEEGGRGELPLMYKTFSAVSKNNNNNSIRYNKSKKKKPNYGNMREGCCRGRESRGWVGSTTQESVD